MKKGILSTKPTMRCQQLSSSFHLPLLGTPSLPANLKDLQFYCGTKQANQTGGKKKKKKRFLGFYPESIQGEYLSSFQ